MVQRCAACKWLRLPHQVYGTELKNLMERFIQHTSKTELSALMTIYLVERRIAIGSICMELAEVICTVPAYGNGQSAVHDILGMGWGLG